MTTRKRTALPELPINAQLAAAAAAAASGVDNAAAAAAESVRAQQIELCGTVELCVRFGALGGGGAPLRDALRGAGVALPHNVRMHEAGVAAMMGNADAVHVLLTEPPPPPDSGGTHARTNELVSLAHLALDEYHFDVARVVVTPALLLAEPALRKRVLAMCGDDAAGDAHAAALYAQARAALPCAGAVPVPAPAVAAAAAAAPQRRRPQRARAPPIAFALCPRCNRYTRCACKSD